MSNQSRCIFCVHSHIKKSACRIQLDFFWSFYLLRPALSFFHWFLHNSTDSFIIELPECCQFEKIICESIPRIMQVIRTPSADSLTKFGPAIILATKMKPRIDLSIFTAKKTSIKTTPKSQDMNCDFRSQSTNKQSAIYSMIGKTIKIFWILTALTSLCIFAHKQDSFGPCSLILSS